MAIWHAAQLCSTGSSDFARVLALAAGAERAAE